MNVLKSIMLGGCLAALTLGASNQVMAQGRGGDPAQRRQERIDRAREYLEIKDDTEWKALEPLVTKVMDAERDVIGVRMAGMFRGGPRRGGDTNNASSQRQRFNPFGEPSAVQTALEKAIENKAPKAELKTKIAAVRADIKAKEAKLDAAQEELRGVLTTRQEAIAVANGLLK
jgi:hypothetical protein